MLTLNNVLYAPRLKTRILSLGRLDDQRFKVELESGYLTILDQQRRLLARVKKMQGKLYPLKLTMIDHCLVSKEDETEWLWHRRYGRLNFNCLKSLPNVVRGLPPLQKLKSLC